MKKTLLKTLKLMIVLFPSISFANNEFLDNFTAEKITENVYVIHGPTADPIADNQGFINNPSFVIVNEGVVVIDPGSSLAIGQMVLKNIKQLSQLPVIAIFNTHEHGDHWLGNHAIVDAYPDIPIYAHSKMIESLNNGAGTNWLSLMNRLTKNATKGTQIKVPTHPVKNGDEIVLGDHTFKIHHNNISHTHNDIMIEVVESQTVFLGDNAFLNRLPRLDEGDVVGNIDALRSILKTSSKFYVPGHGPSGDSSVVNLYLEYLNTLYDSVKYYYEEDLSDFEMKNQVATKMKKFSEWYGFETELGKNISLVFLQIESADF
ncbi:MAG: MBL fold metallo-hydrolase [Gammaproteobacteria bacterium]